MQFELETNRTPSSGFALARLATVVAGVGALAMTQGCATTAAKPQNVASEKGPFPTAAVLADIVKRPLKAVEYDRKVDIEAFELRGPLPDMAGPVPLVELTDPNQQRLLDLLKTRSAESGAMISTGAHCVARSIGHVVLESGQSAGPRLLNFINGRCGFIASKVAMQWQSGDVEDTFTDDQIFEDWGPGFKEAISKLPLGKQTSVGIAYVRTETKAGVFFVVGQRTITVEPFANTPVNGEVIIRGSFSTPSTSMFSYVTQGRYRSNPCVDNPKIALPVFEITCPVDDKDDLAWIALSSLEPGNLFGRRQLLVAVRPSGSDARKYQKVTYAPAAPVEATGTAFVALLNSVRADAGLGPIALDVGQSQTASELTPHLTSTQLKSPDDALSNKIFMGMLAGWDLADDDTISDAAVGFSSAYAGSPDRAVGELLSVALEQPGSRSFLLNKEADILAIGLFTDKKSGIISALFGTYARFEGLEAGLADAFYQKVVDARAARKLFAPTRFTEAFDAVEQAAASVNEGTAPNGALNPMLQQALAGGAQQVTGFFLEATKLDSVEVPAELLKAEPLRIAVSVAYRRPPGSKWGRYVIIIARDTSNVGKMAQAPVDNVTVASR